MEPFEDPLAFDRVHARPTIEHGQGPPTDDHVDGATRRIELARVVDEVGDRAVERRAGCVDGGLVGGGHRDRTGSAATHTFGDVGREVGEHDPLGRLAVEFARRHRDQLVDEIGELGHLAVEVVQHAAAHLGIHVGVTTQHGQVRPQAGERRAELVAGVLHEAPLLGA